MMNEKKLNIIKKILGVHDWTLKEDKYFDPYLIFIFDEDGKYIMSYDYNEKVNELRYSIYLRRKIKSLFGFGLARAEEVIKSIVLTEGIANRGVTPLSGLPSQHKAENYFFGDL